MEILAYIVHLAFSVYTLFLFAVVVGSWFPQLSQKSFMRFLRYYVDPYLNFFRRIIPPIGGVLDLSPILAFFSLTLLEKIIVSFLGAR